jgi:activator of HSP90 ATPase
MKEYKKYYLIPAPPEELYLALTTPSTILLWSGYEAMMGTEPGSEFSLFEDSISGINLEFIPGKKLVQQWFFGEQAEPSIVTIILHPHKQGTSVELRHTNIPDSDFEEVTEGWDNYYFGALIDFYEE